MRNWKIQEFIISITSSVDIYTASNLISLSRPDQKAPKLLTNCINKNIYKCFKLDRRVFRVNIETKPAHGLGLLTWKIGHSLRKYNVLRDIFKGEYFENICNSSSIIGNVAVTTLRSPNSITLSTNVTSAHLKTSRTFQFYLPHLLSLLTFFEWKEHHFECPYVMPYSSSLAIKLAVRLGTVDSKRKRVTMWHEFERCNEFYDTKEVTLLETPPTSC